MPFQDLREYIDVLEQHGELLRVDGADWKRDIGTLTEIVSEKNGPAVLFDKIEGYPSGYRVLSNISTRRDLYLLALQWSLKISNIDLVRLWRKKLKEYKPIPPVFVDDGPVMENVYKDEQVDLWKFPTPIWHELDGGRYIGTGCMIITEDPEEHWVNSGVYRVQIHEKNLTGLYMSPGRHAELHMQKYWAKGKSAPVVVTFGQEAVTYSASSFTMKYGESEFDMAGYLRGAPVEMIRGPQTGLPIPATAEIVIEGEVPDPSVESRIEGPFGEWPGYYAHGARNELVIHAKSLYHRNDPIILGDPPLKPPKWSVGTITRSAMVWEEMEAAGIAGIKGVYQLEAGGPKLILAVSLKQLYQGHAKEAAMVASGCHAGSHYEKILIVVDEDIDPSDINQVFWAMVTRSEPSEAIDIIKGVRSSALDPAIPPERKDRKDFASSRAIIHACKPYTWIKNFPPVCSSSPETKKTVAEKWSNALSKISSKAA